MPQNLFSGRFPLPQKVHVMGVNSLFKDTSAFEQQLSSEMRIPGAVLLGLRGNCFLAFSFLVLSCYGLSECRVRSANKKNGFNPVKKACVYIHSEAPAAGSASGQRSFLTTSFLGQDM